MQCRLLHAGVWGVPGLFNLTGSLPRYCRSDRCEPTSCSIDDIETTSNSKGQTEVLQRRKECNTGIKDTERKKQIRRHYTWAVISVVNFAQTTMISKRQNASMLKLRI